MLEWLRDCRGEHGVILQLIEVTLRPDEGDDAKVARPDGLMCEPSIGSLSMRSCRRPPDSLTARRVTKGSGVRWARLVTTFGAAPLRPRRCFG